jgi:DNA-binding response OmpR family regulator
MPSPKPHILLIDDSLIDLRLLIESLTAHNMRISVAFNGRDGLVKADLLQPDLIVLDLNMPDLDGFTVCRLLRQGEHTRHTPVIFLSANNDADTRVEGLALGAVDFVSKPFHAMEMLARVQVHLELSRANRQWVQQTHTQRDETNPGTLANMASQRDAGLVRAAVEHLRDHITEPPSTDALASLLGTHEKRLTQAFQTQFGMPVFAWLREERLQQARHLLSTTNTPITAMGEYLGYATTSNFSKAFKERLGCTPREYRQHNSHFPEPGAHVEPD